jgi:MFS family permease
VKYSIKHSRQEELSNGLGWISEVKEGWIFISKTKGFLIFGICSFMPYIVGMVSNFLAPVFVSQTLHADVGIFSTGEIVYAVGAIIAGIFLAQKVKVKQQMISMIIGILFLAAVLCSMVLLNKSWAFIFMFLILGWSTASTRLFSLNIYMEMVPENLMGRVMSFLNVISLMIRALLIGIFTGVIDTIGAGIGFYILAVLLFLGSIGISYSLRKILFTTRYLGSESINEGQS